MDREKAVSKIMEVGRLRMAFFLSIQSRPDSLALFCPARIIGRIDVVELQWGGAVDLDHNFSAGHGVVMHVGIQISETASWENSHLAFVKAISHANLEGPRDDRDVFPLRMPMRRDAISVRHLQTHGVVAAGGTWIALKYCELRPWGHKCRRWTPCNSIGRKRVFLRGAGLSSTGEDQARPAQKSDQGEVRVSLHRLPPSLN